MNLRAIDSTIQRLHDETQPFDMRQHSRCIIGFAKCLFSFSLAEAFDIPVDVARELTIPHINYIMRADRYDAILALENLKRGAQTQADLWSHVIARESKKEHVDA